MLKLSQVDSMYTNLDRQIKEVVKESSAKTENLRRSEQSKKSRHGEESSVPSRPPMHTVYLRAMSCIHIPVER